MVAARGDHAAALVGQTSLLRLFLKDQTQSSIETDCEDCEVVERKLDTTA